MISMDETPFLMWYMHKILIDNTICSSRDLDKYTDDELKICLKKLFLKNTLKNRLILMNEFNTRYACSKC